jgi:drug/metabolite transporter (DMT)-like permease
MATLQRLTLSGAVILVLICAIWGTNQTAIKITNEGFPPTLNAGLRSAGAGILMVAWCLWRGIPFFKPDRTLPWGILVGVLFTFEFLLAYQGLALTDASRGVLLIFVCPFVTAIGAHFLAAGERLTWLHALGLLVAFLGLVVVFADGLTSPRPGQIAGDVMCFMFGVLWGLDNLTMKVSPLRTISAERALFYSFSISGILLPLASLLLGESWNLAPSMRALGAFAYTVIVVSFFSYIIFLWFIRRYPATLFGAFMFLSPVFGVITASVVLGEALKPSLLVALGLIALGIFLVNRTQGAARAE